MTVTTTGDFPHPICRRTYEFIDKKRGKSGLNAFMREYGLNKSRYHNLKRSVPTADSLMEILSKLKATKAETMEVLGIVSEEGGKRVGGGSEDTDTIEVIANELSANVEKLKALIQKNSNVVGARKKMLNLEYINHVLKTKEITPQRFSSLCGLPSDYETTIIALIEGKQNIEEFDAYDKSIIHFLANGLANITGRSPEEESIRLSNELTCGNKL
ncbi:hypothetical protein [Spirulina sp. 06S082]|uniref:hypothetical protein n=1 Tax=Spirulina sp. 06S082 TaxID=3110248 RepID=UPI002B20FCCD|nr:hypothetical protein [Spirulina sp. 06S082]MEA5467997.1 hypothetical protein [Spirulina sp. 06S082]